MFKKFFKISKIILMLIIAFNFSFAFLNVKTFAASSNIYYISTSIGETYDTIGINYHCNYENSYVLFSTKENLADSIKVEATSRLWSVDQLSTDSSTGFSERFVCNVKLEGLKSNTKYYYKIYANGESSNLYSFRTESNNTRKHEIILLADTQSSNVSSFQRADKVVQMLQSKAPNAKLALVAGDVVDRGGYEAQWSSCFEGMKTFNNLIYATVPGNHEYYHSSASSYVDPSFYNQFFYNPQNGPETKQNSSYYFKYDNILFIMLDVIGSLGSTAEDKADMEAHREWFKNVVENNPSQWIIVGSHAGLISAGNYQSDAKTMANNFRDLFEYYQVDLAFSGHEHIYTRADTRYKNQKDEKLGVTYLVCPATGGKQYALKESSAFGAPFDEVIDKSQNYSGQVMRFNGDQLVVDYYLENGTLKTSFTLNAKRPAKIESVSNQEVEDSIKFDYKADEERVYVSWSNKLYGNAKNVSITEGNKTTYSMDVQSNVANEYIIKAVYVGNVYDFGCQITMNDGTVISKSFKLDIGWDSQEFKINYDLNDGEWENGFTPQTSYINKDGVETLPRPIRENYVFKGWYDELGNKVTSIEPDSRQDFNLKAEWHRGEPTKKINYTLDGGKLPADAPTTYEVFVGLEELPIPTKKGHIFLGWQRNGEFVTSISDEETGNIYLTAVWKKTGGCKKSGAEIMIATLSALSLSVLVLRKKH